MGKYILQVHPCHSFVCCSLILKYNLLTNTSTLYVCDHFVECCLGLCFIPSIRCFCFCIYVLLWGLFGDFCYSLILPIILFNAFDNNKCIYYIPKTSLGIMHVVSCLCKPFFPVCISSFCSGKEFLDTSFCTCFAFDETPVKNISHSNWDIPLKNVSCVFVVKKNQDRFKQNNSEKTSNITISMTLSDDIITISNDSIRWQYEY